MTTANETSEGDIVSALVGLDEPRAGHPLRDRGALIRIRDATRRISPTFEIEIPSIDIVPGEITAVVGANGAGKTTLLRVVAGLLAIDRGTWLHRFRNDDDPGGLRLGDFELPDFVAIRDAIHVVPSPHMYQMTVRLDLVTTAVASGYRGPKARARALTWLHRMGLAPYAEQLYRTLSDGYRVRADIARAMVRKPQVLVLDEPLGPLDVLAQEKILADLRDIADSRTWPMPVVVSSQHLSEIESIADNVIFVRGGMRRVFRAGTRPARGSRTRRIRGPVLARFESAGIGRGRHRERSHRPSDVGRGHPDAPRHEARRRLARHPGRGRCGRGVPGHQPIVTDVVRRGEQMRFALWLNRWRERALLRDSWWARFQPVPLAALFAVAVAAAVLAHSITASAFATPRLIVDSFSATAVASGAVVLAAVMIGFGRRHLVPTSVARQTSVAASRMAVICLMASIPFGGWAYTSWSQARQVDSRGALAVLCAIDAAAGEHRVAGRIHVLQDSACAVATPRDAFADGLVASAGFAETPGHWTDGTETFYIPHELVAATVSFGEALRWEGAVARSWIPDPRTLVLFAAALTALLLSFFQSVAGGSVTWSRCRPRQPSDWRVWAVAAGLGGWGCALACLWSGVTDPVVLVTTTVASVSVFLAALGAAVLAGARAGRATSATCA